MELILVLRILYLYYGAYTCLTNLILELRSLFLYFRSYTCIMEHILVLRILYLYYGAYTCLTNLILVLRSIYLSYGSYTCRTNLMPVLRDLFLCEGTHRFILVHISRRTHISTYIRFIYLYRNTYTRTCPYHKHILIKSLVGVIELLCVRRYP